MKYASIDIGTNTVLLLVAELRDGSLNELYDTARITRLGEGLKSSGVLSETAMDRTFTALARYKEEAIERGAEEILCVGTAALREAANRDLFVQRVRDELGISVKVISARDEAYYTWLSVARDRLSDSGRFLVVDVGGGSTEVIEGTDTEFRDFVSLPVGSVKLTEMFIRSDPPREEELLRLRAFLREAISVPFDGKDCTLVATAGTATNLASLVQGIEEYDKSKVHGFAVSREAIDSLIGKMGCLKTEERRNLKGMESGREDILLQGIILIREIMTYFDVPELVVSANGGRYGVLYERARCFRGRVS